MNAPAQSIDHKAILPILEDFGSHARQNLSTLALHTGLAVAGGLLLSLFLHSMTGPGQFLVWLPAIAGLLYGAFTFQRIRSAYRARFKEQVVRSIINGAYPGLHYDARGAISRSEFDASGLFLQDIDDFDGEDLIEGQIGATRIRFSEVRARDRRTRTDSKGHTHTEWVTVFRGTFLVADFNKHFAGATFVLPDTAQRFLGGIGQSLQSLDRRRGELVKLEDPEFERRFVVYSTDQVEARYILSTSLMQRILDFQNRAGQPLHIAFIHSRLFLAIPSTRDALEPPSLLLIANMHSNPSIRSRILAHLRSYTTYLDMTTGVIHELDLNERIWGR
jgi:hypothetical protein